MNKKILLPGIATLVACTACSEKLPTLQGEGIASLSGTSWQFVNANTTKDCQELPPIIDFLNKEKVAGNLGCNLLTATYKHDGKALRFETIGTTRRMCAPEVIKTEQHLAGVLEATRFVTQNKRGLMFWDEKGKLLAQLEPEVAGACQ